MNQRIKVIKLAERERQAEARIAKRIASASHIAQELAPDAAKTITGWVGELRQQKQNSAETTQSFKSLFEDTT